MTTQDQKEQAGSVAPDNKKKLLDESMQLAEQMRGDRTTWNSHWQALANYVNPRGAYITTKTEQPTAMKESLLFDSTAVQANLTLAAGHMTWMTPLESLWFTFDPPEALKKDDEAKAWFHRVTIITAQEMARSNFYTEVHEGYLDRGGYGTCAMFVGAGKRSPIHFRHEDIGTYSIAEDDEGYPDTMARDFKLTYHQAIQKFGEQGVHPKLLEGYNKDVKLRNKELDFIHLTMPRLERDPKKPNTSLNMAFSSVYIDTHHQHLCEVGGYDELPYMVSRYLKWGRSPYGWSPGWMSLPESRQLNFLQKNLDLLSELVLFPRILAPGSLKSRIDLRPGGVTYLKDGVGPESFPKEWGTVADIGKGMERAEQKEAKIKEAFHVDLFKMFAQIDRQMTATEVTERAAEKLIQFSPTFSRLSVEFYQPTLKRVFRLLYNMGKFPPPPRSVVQILGGTVLIAEPSIVFNSRIALAMKQMENVGFLRTMNSLQPIAALKPDLLDHYNWNAIVRDMARNDITPEDWILPAEQVQAIQQARAEAQQRLEHAQIAEQASGAVAKLGSVPHDSPIADIIKKQAGSLPGMPQA